MKHSRSDYDRIQDPAVKDQTLLGEGCTAIGEDEPVFLVRGQDEFAPHCVLDYAARCEVRGLDAMASELREFADRMFKWQNANKKKLPDLPAPKAAPAKKAGK